MMPTLPDPEQLCAACGGTAGRWSTVRVGDQPVRVDSAVLVGRMCPNCKAIDLCGRVPSSDSAARPHGRDVLGGFLRNVVEAVRAVARALSTRYGSRDN